MIDKERLKNAVLGSGYIKQIDLLNLLALIDRQPDEESRQNIAGVTRSLIGSCREGDGTLKKCEPCPQGNCKWAERTIRESCGIEEGE